MEIPTGFAHAELFGPLVAKEARGHRLGTQLLDASIERARGRRRNAGYASVGTRNAAGQILLERHGFTARGRPQATFKLQPSAHRPLDEAPEGVTVRLATEDDLPAALELYRECFPAGRFPDEVWRTNVANGTVYAGEQDGSIVAVLNIDPSDRWIYHVGVTASERNRGVGSYLLSRSLERYWAEHPGAGARPRRGRGQRPRDPAVPPAGLRAAGSCSRRSSWPRASRLERLADALAPPRAAVRPPAGGASASRSASSSSGEGSGVTSKPG